MSITNTSKPSASVTNGTRVISGTTWDAETHTWNSDPFTWDQKATNMSNVTKVSAVITNISKPA